MPRRSRPPQLGPILVAPDWQVPNPSKRQRWAEAPLVLAPTSGDEVYDWEKPIVFEPEATESPTPGDNVLRAPRTDPATDVELRDLPSGTGWMQSDGVRLSPDKSMAKHDFDGRVERTAVLSRDWVHTSHAPSSEGATWLVSAIDCTHEYGDILFGVTEASSFEHPGRTLVFDAHGNFRTGWHPLNLVHFHDAEDLNLTPGAAYSWDVTKEWDANRVMRVEVSLTEQFVQVTYGETGYARFALDKWTTARLCASFSCPNNTLKIHAGPGAPEAQSA